MEVSTKRKEIADKHQKMCRSTKKKGKSGKNHEKGVGKCKAFVELLVGGKWQENGRKKQWVGQVRNLPWNRKMAAKLTSELYYLYFFQLFPLHLCTERKEITKK